MPPLKRTCNEDQKKSFVNRFDDDVSWSFQSPLSLWILQPILFMLFYYGEAFKKIYSVKATNNTATIIILIMMMMKIIE